MHYGNENMDGKYNRHNATMQKIKQLLKTKKYSWKYYHLEIVCCLFQRTHTVALMFLGRVTNTAENLFILLAEQFESLPMSGTKSLRFGRPVGGI